MRRLTDALGGPNLFIKRHDCTDLGIGSNKTRKLEFDGRRGQARRGQHHHARRDAVKPCAPDHRHCRKMGMRCEIRLENRTGSNDEAYKYSGNVFLYHLYGAHVTERPGCTDMAAAMNGVADALRAEGRKPYVILGGGSNPIGALGYVV